MKTEGTNEKTQEKKYSRKIIISLIVVVILVFSVITLSFTAYVNLEKKEQAKNEEQHQHEQSQKGQDNVFMTYVEDINGIRIENASPVRDEVGKALNGKGQYFDFTVSTKISKKTPIVYEIAAIKDKNSTLDDKDVKIYLEKQNSGTYEQVFEPQPFTALSEKTQVGSPKGAMVLKKVKKTKSGSDNYRLRMWISDKATITDVKTYTVTVNVYGVYGD